MREKKEIPYFKLANILTSHYNNPKEIAIEGI
jgi:hypothetical protein